jgi:hypothetical protein
MVEARIRGPGNRRQWSDNKVESFGEYQRGDMAPHPAVLDDASVTMPKVKPQNHQLI